MASTVLPNGIIIPEKYSRDWYNDLYHNWQELDNLLGGGTPKDGTLTIQKNGATVGTFSANQATDETIDITVPAVNDATLTIQQNGTTVDTFSANSSTDKTVNITVPTKTSDLTNDIGYITEDTTKIPLAGSNQISGDLIPSTDGTVNLGSFDRIYKSVWSGEVYGNMKKIGLHSIYGNATNYKYYNGAGVTFTSKDYAAPSMTGVFEIFAASNGSSAMFFRGKPNGTLTWDGQPIQYTSDQRLKQQIAEIDDKLLDAWEDVNLVQFKYNDAVKEKSDNARLHTGYVVQQIDSACKSHSVDVSAYGLYCHEEYSQETEEVEVEQADGTKVKETRVIREASEHYSLRYTEVYAVECMYLRRCIARLTARIEELEKGKEAEK